MPKREQNTAPAAETKSSMPATRRTQQAPQFRSIRELADNLRKQANEAAARFGTMTPSFNPHAGLPAGKSGGVNPQLPVAAAPQQNKPSFTSFRQLAEHLKQQAYDELSGATIGGRLNTGGSPMSNGQPFYGAATHNSFRPPIMKDPETIRQLAERLRREAAGEVRNSFTPLDTTPQNTEGNGMGAENANNYSPVIERESSASENPYRMMRNGEASSAAISRSGRLPEQRESTNTPQSKMVSIPIDIDGIYTAPGEYPGGFVKPAD